MTGRELNYGLTSREVSACCLRTSPHTNKRYDWLRTALELCMMKLKTGLSALWTNLNPLAPCQTIWPQNLIIQKMKLEMGPHVSVPKLLLSMHKNGVIIKGTPLEWEEKWTFFAIRIAPESASVVTETVGNLVPLTGLPVPPSLNFTADAWVLFFGVLILDLTALGGVIFVSGLSEGLSSSVYKHCFLAAERGERGLGKG